MMAAEKNIFLLLLISPIFLLNKQTKYKKIFVTVLFFILEPILVFALVDAPSVIPQLRYFAGVNCVILILIVLIINELYGVKIKYLSLILVIFNSYIIFDNISKHNKINNLISKKHSFFNFNENIGVDKSKVLYLINLNFQESINQNLYYIKLYENDLILKTDGSKKFLNNIKKKISIIKNTRDINIENLNLKENIIYFNYSLFEISDLKAFFDFVKKDFEFI